MKEKPGEGPHPIRTFRDVKEKDGSYRLQMSAADISRAKLLVCSGHCRLRYRADDLEVADAVRMSVSIPYSSSQFASGTLTERTATSWTGVSSATSPSGFMMMTSRREILLSGSAWWMMVRPVPSMGWCPCSRPSWRPCWKPGTSGISRMKNYQLSRFPHSAFRPAIFISPGTGRKRSILPAGRRRSSISMSWQEEQVHARHCPIHKQKTAMRRRVQETA